MNSMNVFNTRYVSSTLPTAIILFQSNNKTFVRTEIKVFLFLEPTKHRIKGGGYFTALGAFYLSKIVFLKCVVRYSVTMSCFY